MYNGNSCSFGMAAPVTRQRALSSKGKDAKKEKNSWNSFPAKDKI
jgi:hypothetical protein